MQRPMGAQDLLQSGMGHTQMSKRIKYKAGYKYQLHEAYRVMTGITGYLISTGYLALDLDGMLHIQDGYAWDGPSGPTVDTPAFMRGSLVHDALYQLIRTGHIGIRHRKDADILLREICREDGMSAIRAWWVYQGVRFGGGDAVESDNPIITAP